MKPKRRPKKSIKAVETETISARTFWRWKRQSQARDREVLASGKVPPEHALLLPPERLKGATIVWPKASLIDDPPKSKRQLALKPKRGKKTRPSSRIVSTQKSGLGLLAGTTPIVLILGSFPSEESLRARQYYANPKNQFWRLLERIAGIKHDQSYGQRVQAMKAKGIALWDVVRSCERSGSMDSKIRMDTVVTNDLADLLGRMPSIRVIGLNGGTAEKIFNRHFSAYAPRLEVVSLPSSSSAHAIKLEQKVQAWSILMSSAERKGLQQYRGVSASHNQRIEKHRSFGESLTYIRQRSDEQLASLQRPDAAKRLRAAIKSPARLRSGVKSRG